MQHRDKIILEKILSEIDIAFDMLGEADQDEFLKDEKLKRAVKSSDCFGSPFSLPRNCLRTKKK